MQQPPDQPQYQSDVPTYLSQQAPPPPKKQSRRKFFAIGCGGLVVLAIIIGIAVAATSNAGKSNTPSTGTNATQPAQATQAPAQAPKIGTPVVVNDTWTVTVNKTSTSQGSDFITPKAGNTFLMVDVTVKNTSSTVQHASGLVQWSLKDSTGQTYTDDIALGTDPGGTVAAGSLVRGQLAFEVPKSVHQYTLQFVPDIGSNTLVEWNLSI